MTILTFINTDANMGGAGRAACTLLKNVQDEDIRARLYVKYSGVVDEDVRIIRTGLMRSKCQEVVNRIFVSRGYPDIFRFTTLELAHDPWIRRTDIFQLYNLHGGYFSLRFLPYVVGGKPVVWRMPDLWPITGGCAYPYDCGKWLTGCGECPTLNEYPSLKRDTTRWWFRTKRSTYSKLNITVVATSDWIRGIVKRSPLLGDCNIVRIPAGIDMRTFKPIDKKAARSKLRIREDSRVLLLSANNFSSSRKVDGAFADMLGKVCAEAPDNLLLLLAGNGEPELPENTSGRVRKLGKISSEADMAAVYSAADVFAFPTRADNLPKAPVESLACGTPCVASNVGGIPEIIEHGENGLLVDTGDNNTFAQAVLRLLYDEELNRNMRTRCRNSVIGKYDVEDEVSAYRQLYESLSGGLVPPSPVLQRTEQNIFATRQYATHTAV